MSSQEKLDLDSEQKRDGPIECFGTTFESDEARRTYFLKELDKKLKDPEFRKIPGFPKGEDDDILRLSDPPYYTACPNPFLGEYVKSFGNRNEPETTYHREPYSADVNEGKGGKVYKAHTYHTKVPHEAIARYIVHFTNPGDLVLDVFCGSGMTGVAAAYCENPDAEFKNSVEKEFDVQWGLRRTILVDLSPFATFLSANMTYPWYPSEFRKAASLLIEETRKALPGNIYGIPPVNYVLWSQVLLCPECGSSLLFAEEAMKTGTISSKFSCQECGAHVSKSSCQKKHTVTFDDLLNIPVTQNEYQPIRVNIEGQKGLVELRDTDRTALDVASTLHSDEIPVVPMMFKGAVDWGAMYRAGYHFGISHAHHFWTPRNLKVISTMWNTASKLKHPNQMRLLITSFMVKTGSRMHNVGMKDEKVNLAGQIFNTLQIPSIYAERNIFELAAGKLEDLEKIFSIPKSRDGTIISTGSGVKLSLPEKCVDYVFIDPPFGGNIMYSEMSFLYESWLGVFTQSGDDSIVSKKQGKSLSWYKEKMYESLAEVYRVLKPGRWLTVAFHNSKNEVWIALQEALQHAGFVIADVRVLDKGQGTYKQMTTGGAVEKDLAISSYRPTSELEEKLALEIGSETAVWNFTRMHLGQLPNVVKNVDGDLEVISERQAHMLFDRMVAFHVQRGVSVPVSAGDYYKGLAQRFPVREDMYFLAEQVASFDRERARAKEVMQLEISISDEASAIQWLKARLSKKPQSFQEVHPAFLKELGGWLKHEKMAELRDELLAQNFLCYEGDEAVPSQIHSYLSSNYKELRKLNKNDSELKKKAKGRWYVPDPNKQSDLEKLRLRTLLREFEDYKESKKNKLKEFRTEALRAGFKVAYDSQNYQTIVNVSQKIPESVLKEDDKLIMYYDVARTRLGSG